MSKKRLDIEHNQQPTLKVNNSENPSSLEFGKMHPYDPLFNTILPDSKHHMLSKFNDNNDNNLNNNIIINAAKKDNSSDENNMDLQKALKEIDDLLNMFDPDSNQNNDDPNVNLTGGAVDNNPNDVNNLDG
ncbi:MAG: hypothetical protein HRU35_01460 [Rickettsiaceae bacterium]|nr:hypothetical protein [Rickettsiaceae bacterium]